MADDDRPEGEPGPDRTPLGGLEGLQLVFGIVACLGVYFYFRGPAANEAQFLFRFGVMVVGTVGLAVVTILKLVRRRRP